MAFDEKPDLSAPHIIHLGHSNYLLRDIRIPNCITSLLEENTERVKQLCEFSVKINSLKSQIIPIGVGQAIFIDIDQVTLDCESQRSVQKTGCFYCLFKIPCGCELKWRDVVMPQQLGSCLGRADGATVLHAINLRAIQAFFKSEEINTLSGSSLFPNELQVNLPKMKLWEAKTTQNLAKIEQIDLDLDTLAAHAANESVVYKSMEEVISDKLESIQTQIPIKKWFTDYLLYGIAVLSGIALLFSMVTATRMKMLVASMAALHPASAAGTSAVNLSTPVLPVLPVLNFRKSMSITGAGEQLISTTTAVTDIKIQDWFVRLTNFEITVLVLLTLMLILLVATLKQYRKQILGEKFTIEVHLGASTQCVRITMMTLRQTFCNYEFSASTFVNNIRVTGCIFTQFEIKWPTLKIKHRMTKQDYDLPTKVWINPITAHRVRQMVKREFGLLVMTNNGQQITLIDLQGSSWQNCVKPDRFKSSNISCPTLNLPEFYSEDTEETV